MSESPTSREGQDREWVGGRLASPTSVTLDGKTVRPDVVVWLDLGIGAVVGSRVVLPQEPMAVVGDCLRTAMEEPLEGPPRRPSRVRVASEELAVAVRREMAGAQVIVAPTPEIDQLRGQIAGGLPHRQEVPTYLCDGRVAAGVVAAFFTATAELHRAAPWEVVTDDFLLAVSIPALGVPDGCVSVIGALGHARGMVLFPSMTDFQRFSTTATCPRHNRPASVPAAHMLSVTFEQGALLPVSMRREVAERGWEVATSHAYPSLTRLDPDNVCRPLSELDYRVATVCSACIARFFNQHRDRLPTVEQNRINETYRLHAEPEPIVVELMAPHPEASLVYRDSEAPGASVVTRPTATAPGGDSGDAEEALDSLLGDFLLAQSLDGWDETLCDLAELACGELLAWKLRATEGRLDRWTAADVETFMLQVFPDRVGGDNAALSTVPDIFTALFVWLADTGQIPARTAEAARRRVAKIRRRFLALVHPDQPGGELVQIDDYRKK